MPSGRFGGAEAVARGDTRAPQFSEHPRRSKDYARSMPRAASFIAAGNYHAQRAVADIWSGGALFPLFLSSWRDRSSPLHQNRERREAISNRSAPRFTGRAEATFNVVSRIATHRASRSWLARYPCALSSMRERNMRLEGEARQTGLLLVCSSRGRSFAIVRNANDSFVFTDVRVSRT
jgi:hypothetical protein